MKRNIFHAFNYFVYLCIKCMKNELFFNNIIKELLMNLSHLESEFSRTDVRLFNKFSFSLCLDSFLLNFVSYNNTFSRMIDDIQVTLSLFNLRLRRNLGVEQFLVIICKKLLCSQRLFIHLLVC